MSFIWSTINHPKQQQYFFSFCRPGLTAAHMNWITNVGDRSAAGLIVMAGTALYHEELAKHIRTHFSELLDDLQHVESDNDDGSDNEQGAGADA